MSPKRTPGAASRSIIIDLWRTGGPNDADNLLYCCFRCNLYKADHWPTQATDPLLWNPRQERLEAHLLTLADGTLHPITAIGVFTLRRLRLNRPPLVAYRRRQSTQAEERRLLSRYRDLLRLLEQLHEQQAALLEEQRTLLQEQRAWLRRLLGGPRRE